MTVEIEFCDPPANPRSRGHSKWFEVVATLAARPGEWAKIKTFERADSARNMAGNIRRGYGAWGPAGTVEAAARGCDVYARYVGGAR